jgi:hypothetical protein
MSEYFVTGVRPRAPVICAEKTGLFKKCWRTETYANHSKFVDDKIGQKKFLPVPLLNLGKKPVMAPARPNYGFTYKSMSIVVDESIVVVQALPSCN